MVALFDQLHNTPNTTGPTHPNVNKLSDCVPKTHHQEILTSELPGESDPLYTECGEDHLYGLPVTTPLPDYLTYIRTMPLNDTPSIFGLHPNADISYAQSETFNCLATLLALQPRVVSGEAHSKEDVTAQVAANIDETVPDIFDEEVISFRYPVLYEESLNTVLVQEVIRYNKLLSVIHSSIGEMLRALKGLVVMSQALEEMSHSIFTNAVPNMWANRAYPSLKPLGAWVKDLQQRIEFLKGWIDDGIPPLFWISGFYFPQAFLTGTMQNFARKCVISIDSIDFNFKVLEQIPTTRPEDGCYIYGLFLEGARWDENIHMLAESRKKELYTALPVVWLIPKENRKLPESGMYQCPVYKTLTRAGTLSTTGHSTNYVVTIEIPSDRPQKHWIKRGVALFCALDF
uniref:Dynein heavy chain C-terminal domain-containing protein n=1 Tax=Timema cristinae TaxID=61476 RepID=A0A7R9CEZ4_TIMCR|nr:unnamed protein product [Timema cristinae]